MSAIVRISKTFRGGPESAAFHLDVAFEAQRGVNVLFGPSGSGKSLTLDCIAGFQKPDTGRILLADHILYDHDAGVNVKPQKRECGYVFQNQALFPHMSVRENLMFAAERLPRLERHRQVRETLERFKLTDLAGRRPAQISGGQRQRCAIARALISSPRALLLDEPSTGLDAELRSELEGLVRELRTGFDIPILFVTHNLDEALALADRMLLYSGGTIIQSGTPSEIFANPASGEVARLLGPMNLLEAEILALDPGRDLSRLRLRGGDLTARYLPGHLIGDRVELAVSAQDLRVEVSPGENRIPMQLQSTVQLAHAIELRFDGSLTVLVSRAGYEDRRDCRELYVEFPVSSLRAIGKARQ